jgi:hypothetical protein
VRKSAKPKNEPASARALPSFIAPLEAIARFGKAISAHASGVSGKPPAVKQEGLER